MIHYFQDGNQFIAVTDESPKGFAGVAYVGKHGPLDRIEETIFTKNQFEKLPRIAKDDVPREWLLALGYDQPAPEPVFVEPVAPMPVEVEEPVEVETEIRVVWATPFEWMRSLPPASPGWQRADQVGQLVAALGMVGIALWLCMR